MPSSGYPTTEPTEAENEVTETLYKGYGNSYSNGSNHSDDKAAELPRKRGRPPKARITATTRRYTQSGYVSSSDIEWTLDNRVSNNDYENANPITPYNPRSLSRYRTPSVRVKDNEKTEKILAKMKPESTKERVAKRAKINNTVSAAMAALREIDPEINIELPQLADNEEWLIDPRGFATYYGETYYLYKKKIEL